MIIILLETFSTLISNIFIVIDGKHQRMRSQSRYFRPLKPVKVDAAESMVPNVAIVTSLVVAFAVVLIALMCVMRWRSKEPGDQEYGISHSFQQWCRRLRGQQPIPSEEPPNLPPLSREELVAAYIDRHKDSDLGFQQEFEV
jgi:protein-tyrosine phosphatase